MSKLKVGILGATGMVGQRYICLLRNHPWFEVAYVAASLNSAGKKYADAVRGRWHMDETIPENIENLVVQNAGNVFTGVDFVFSALEMDKQAVKDLEFAYAGSNIPVVSNSSANRWTEDVPMIIPEINHSHTRIIEAQRKHYNWSRGLIAVKPNCSIQSYLTPVYALMKKGYDPSELIVTTMQAVSGAGYPGVASIDIVDNIIPFINGEEEKTEKEPLKILGRVENGRIINYEGIRISAACTRVPVIDGHTACVSIKFRGKIPELEEVIDIWRRFTSLPQELNLPSAPKHPIIYREEPDRPQPRKDRNSENGMAVTVGRLRNCNVFDIKFTGLSHNTSRGAAGGGILNAELLTAIELIT